MPLLTEPFGPSCYFLRRSRAYWMVAVTGWITLIGFSSTSLAGSWSEQVFHAVSTFLFQQCQLSVGGSALVHFIAEKSIHVCLFAVFAVLLWNALPESFRKLSYVVLAGTVLGCGSEFLQRFFPGRDPAVRDVCINAVATTCGAVVSLVVFHSKSKPAGSHSDELIAPVSGADEKRVEPNLSEHSDPDTLELYALIGPRS